MARQVLKDRPALKADDTVFLNGFPKVRAKMGKLIARYPARNIVQ